MRDEPIVGASSERGVSALERPDMCVPTARTARDVSES
jgi:hypothetical protein